LKIIKSRLELDDFDMKPHKPYTHPKHPLDRQFDTLGEAAKAKTEYLVNVVLKGVDLSSLKK